MPGRSTCATGTISLDDNDAGVALDMVPGEDRPMIRGTVSGGVTLSFMPSGGAAAVAGPVTGRQTRPDGLPIH
jgi:acyl-coenzyme A thioesterase PaaI-like protein